MLNSAPLVPATRSVDLFIACVDAMNRNMRMHKRSASDKDFFFKTGCAGVWKRWWATGSAMWGGTGIRISC
jgi:hypothetical protein